MIGMTYSIPSTEDVRLALRDITQADLRNVSESSGVPISTLIKIRHGVTLNPGIETVRRIYASPVMRKARKARAAVAREA